MKKKIKVIREKTGEEIVTNSLNITFARAVPIEARINTNKSEVITSSFL